MKIYNCLFYYLLLYSYFLFPNYQYNPILVVVIMVKNEGTVIQETLQPFADGGIDAFFVLDTGSTDNTIEQTKQFFEKNNIQHGYIAEEPFIDFATSRNHALELTHQQFPNAAFIVMLDAEWYINDAQALYDYCKACLLQGDTYSSYFIRLLNEFQDFYAARLIRCNCGVQFKGAVHESIDEVTYIQVPDHIYFHWRPQKKGSEKTMTRLIKDRDILFAEYCQNSSTRTLFYLARTCEDLGDLEKAYFFYKQRIKQKGYDQEDAMSYYRLAQTIEKLSYQNKKYKWFTALKYYLKAYELMPHRAEPLISIADYYVRHNNMHLAFMYAHRAALIPYPYGDALFIEKYNYDYYRYELLTRCAWHCNEFEIGKWAAQKAVQARPNYELAHYNLAWYINK